MISDGEIELNKKFAEQAAEYDYQTVILAMTSSIVSIASARSNYITSRFAIEQLTRAINDISAEHLS